MTNKTKNQESKLSINKKVIKNYSKSKSLSEFELSTPTGTVISSSIQF